MCANIFHGCKVLWVKWLAIQWRMRCVRAPSSAGQFVDLSGGHYDRWRCCGWFGWQRCFSGECIVRYFRSVLVGIVAVVAWSSMGVCAAGLPEVEPALVPGTGKPPVIAGEVKIAGNIICSNHTAVGKDRVWVVALDGPKEIKDEYAAILDKYYSNIQGSLNSTQARALQNQFAQRLMYNVDGDQQAELFKASQWSGRTLYNLTGTISAKPDGTVWFTCTAQLPNPKVDPYPAKMKQADVPLSTSAKPPLELKVGGLILKCLHIEPGQFLMGNPYYMLISWQEVPPHMVTLTKGFYVAEIPITNELFKAQLGRDVAAVANLPAGAAANLTFLEAKEFCDSLSASSGKKVRLPSNAELEYVFRCGTSNPPFGEKYHGWEATQSKDAKATKPNNWGIYMWEVLDSWELTGDRPASEHKDVVDPTYPSPVKIGQGAHTGLGMAQNNWPIGEMEYVDGSAGNGVNSYPRYVRARVVVEE
jgi:hypothetical protein